MKFRIFLVGASGVGKTTLMKALVPDPKYHLSASFSEAYRKHNCTPDDLLGDPELSTRVHDDYLTDLADTIRARKKEPFWITDRSFDTFAYRVLMGAHPPGRLERLFLREAGFDGAYADPDEQRFVFFIRPDMEIFEAARKSDGGRRAFFLEPETTYAVDGMLEFYLRDRAIPYTEIKWFSVSPSGRRDFVRDVVEKAGCKLPE